MTAAQDLDANRTTAPSGRRFRPELQGLRALAVWLVVIYHVFLDRVSGGVDVFLFLSALLLSLSFLHRLEDARPLRLLDYWTRTFSRLLPAAAVTIVLTLAAVLVALPEARHLGAVREAVAALLYLENWHLASLEVDYYAADDVAASPFQHFWSLSVQGQIFLLWPLLFVVVGAIARLWGRARPRRSVLFPVVVIFTAVFAASLAWSVHLTRTDQALAYFDTRTRLWEFALGTLVAAVLPFVRLPRALRGVLGWAGVMALIACGMVLDVRGAFPGWIALWPLLATTAVIIAGSSGMRWGVDRILSAPPLVALGNSSYALYLVHWPILILTLNVTGSERADAATGAMVILASLIASLALTRLVDQPLRSFTADRPRVGAGSGSRSDADASGRTRLPRRLGVILACAGLVLMPGALLQQQMQQRQEAAERQNEQAQEQLSEDLAAVQGQDGSPGEGAAEPVVLDYPGALVLDPDLAVSATEGLDPHPELSRIHGQWMEPGEPCLDDLAPQQALLLEDEGCEVLHDAPQPRRTIVMIGSSHAEHWGTAMREVARDNDWRVVALLRPGCTYYDPEGIGLPRCKEFSAAATEYAEQIAPDAVFAQSTVTSADDPEAERLIRGFEERVTHLNAKGIDVIGFRDSPRWSTKRPECIEQHGVNAPECTAQVEQKMAAEDPALVLERHEGFHQMDLTHLVCDPRTGTCPTTAGNIHLWIDSNHLGADYVLSGSEMFADELLETTGWQRSGGGD